MSDRYRVAIIGCKSRAAHDHARGYLSTGECDLVAAADSDPDSVERFAAGYGSSVRRYSDYQDLLEDERPDIVSVCTGPRFQPSVVLDAASADVRAIHGEAPLAPTWGEAKAMRKAAGQKGIQLTFNLAHRLLPTVRATRLLLDRAHLGELQRLEATGADLLDQGTHLLDLFHFWNAESSAEWVLGQIDYSTDRTAHHLPVEGRSLAEIRYQNGVPAILRTGEELGGWERVQIIGALGVIEWRSMAPVLRVRLHEEAGWHTPEGLASDDWEAATARGIADLVQCLSTGAEPFLRSECALRATELVFATYESSRSRGRVDLPLQTEDSAFLSMLASGELDSRARSTSGRD